MKNAKHRLESQKILIFHMKFIGKKDSYEIDVINVNPKQSKYERVCRKVRRYDTDFQSYK